MSSRWTLGVPVLLEAALGVFFALLSGDKIKQRAAVLRNSHEEPLHLEAEYDIRRESLYEIVIENRAVKKYNFIEYFRKNREKPQGEAIVQDKGSSPTVQIGI